MDTGFFASGERASPWPTRSPVGPTLRNRMPITEDAVALSEVSLFSGLTPTQLGWVRQRVHLRTFATGTTIMTAEQPGEVVYFILRGTVKIHIEQKDGMDVILAILGPGDTVGEMSLLDSVGRSASAITLEDTTILWMDNATFREMLQSIPSVTLSLTRVLANRVRLANEQIQSLANLDVYGRVARQLLAFADKYGQEHIEGEVHIPLRLTQTDLADLVGASRKRVNQVVVSFKKQGLISIDGDYHVTVHKREPLARFCK
ncbi:MAG TPA: Crp/Fnr family transcriptional regulator [Anaerolineales bacterium]|nr:Crp/Fnr family transcriptional regulator [Anaerolineales bacterium]